ncbi:MAG: hypothetical protein CMM29_00500 [Rhodospirillaceae bacterium]|nr:hypothetical protein [Rhodospirillaceae bacterium]|tara:strand:- start:232 stop:807 length:576 start_codon:yes stop_codon:yes gene_type:complete
MGRTLLTLLAAFLAHPLSAEATSVVKFSFDSLCETSKRIAHVTCISSEVVETEDGIRTRTRFRVMEGVKGSVGQQFEIALPGGHLGDRRVTVPGVPTFEAGEETVLFLSEPDGTGSRWPVGLGQGCYHVVADEAEGRSVRLQRGATPIPDGALFKPAGGGAYRVELKAFLDKVRETVGEEVVDRQSEDGVK